MNALRDFFTQEAGQQRRQALENALRTYVADPINYFLGPTGIPQRANALMGAAEFTDAGDYAAAAEASSDFWNDPTIGNAAELTAAGVALGLPMYSARLGEGIAQVADDMFAAYDPNTMGAFRVWHGSPHDFDKFSMDKIGTGEGAQAYGHGLYFAEAPEVAEEYRRSLAQTVSIDGTPILRNNRRVGATGDDYLDDILVAHNGDLEAAIAEEAAFAEEMAGKSARRNGGQDPWEVVRKLEALRGRVAAENTGTVYEVAIDAEPEDFLDWDAPLSEQPRVARDGLKSRIEQLKNAGANFGEDPAGDFLWRASHPQGGIDKFDFTMSPAEQAAQRLKGLGIKGVRYYDQGSRGAGEGTRNYVLFDDSLAHILSKNGQPANTPEAQRMRDELVNYLRGAE